MPFLSVRRKALLATVCLLPMLGSHSPAQAQAQRSAPRGRAHAVDTKRAPVRHVHGATIRAIVVDGNQRIEEGTIRSYLLLQVGDHFDSDRIDRSLKTLYATGLFSDVNLHRDGDALVVHVVENPIVNRIAFEGNRTLNDEALRNVLRLRPRAVFTPELAQTDRQSILDAYAKRGRFAASVEPKIIHLDQNRVDVVFEITDGDATYVSRIAFVGNHAFSQQRLHEIINTREERFWRFMSSSDQYDPNRVKFDQELLRRFYLKNGYADFKIVSSNAELSPDRKSFFLTFNVSEGEKYTVGKVSVDSHLRNLDGATLNDIVELSPGDVYDGDSVERTTQNIQDVVESRGFVFVNVQPKITRHTADHTIDLVFDVSEGPRAYVERIDIDGNTRTQDQVLRREFLFAEGDAFNATAARRTRQRLEDMGYFNRVSIAPNPGSTPDKTNVVTTVDEKATGELTLGGGFSSDAGALANAGLRERNLVGTGIDASLNGVLAQRRSQINLSMTDPYFLDRNLVAGFDLFHMNNNNNWIANYSEKRTGATIRLGYQFSGHLSQTLNYSIVDRDVYNIQTGASLWVNSQKGETVLSQVGQTLSLDYRDSPTQPHTGFLMRFGSDFAGLGGDVHYVRTKWDGAYYIPLDSITNNSDWGIALEGSVGYMFNLGSKEPIIDRFYLGGYNLRGFQSGGAGPHTVPTTAYPGADSIGGRFIWTETTELRFPLPISPDIGLSGRVFADVGALSQAGGLRNVNAGQQAITDDGSPRVGAGVGVSWKTPFGLINIDIADPVVKKKYDQTQVFRFGFGTRF